MIYQTKPSSRCDNMSSAILPRPRPRSPQLHLGSAQFAEEPVSKCSTINLHRDKMLMRLNIFFLQIVFLFKKKKLRNHFVEVIKQSEKAPESTAKAPESVAKRRRINRKRRQINGKRRPINNRRNLINGKKWEKAPGSIVKVARSMVKGA